MNPYNLPMLPLRRPEPWWSGAFAPKKDETAYWDKMHPDDVIQNTINAENAAYQPVPIPAAQVPPPVPVPIPPQQGPAQFTPVSQGEPVPQPIQRGLLSPENPQQGGYQPVQGQGMPPGLISPNHQPKGLLSPESMGMFSFGLNMLSPNMNDFRQPYSVGGKLAESVNSGLGAYSGLKKLQTQGETNRLSNEKTLADIDRQRAETEYVRGVKGRQPNPQIFSTILEHKLLNSDPNDPQGFQKAYAETQNIMSGKAPKGLLGQDIPTPLQPASSKEKGFLGKGMDYAGQGFDLAKHKSEDLMKFLSEVLGGADPNDVSLWNNINSVVSELKKRSGQSGLPTSPFSALQGAAEKQLIPKLDPNLPRLKNKNAVGVPGQLPRNLPRLKTGQVPVSNQLSNQQNEGFISAEDYEVFQDIPGATIDEEGFFFQPDRNFPNGKRYIRDEKNKRVRSSRF